MYTAWINVHEITAHANCQDSFVVTYLPSDRTYLFWFGKQDRMFVILVSLGTLVMHLCANDLWYCSQSSASSGTQEYSLFKDARGAGQVWGGEPRHSVEHRQPQVTIIISLC